MTTIKDVVRNGRIETAEPLDLPEGIDLVISLANGAPEEEEDGWDNSSEGIAAWLEWYDSVRPIIPLRRRTLMRKTG